MRLVFSLVLFLMMLSRASASESPLSNAALQLEASLRSAQKELSTHRRYTPSISRTMNQAISVAGVLRLQTQLDPLPGVDVLRHRLDEVNELYLSIAKEMHSTPPFVLSPSQVEAWYEVAGAMGATRLAFSSVFESPNPDYPFPTDPVGYEFTGKIKNTPVYASGSTPAGFMSECIRRVAATELKWMDEITMDDGRRATVRGFFFTPSSACSLMLLNARVTRSHREYVMGGIASMPIRIPSNLSLPALKRLLEAALPHNSGLLNWISEFTINGRRSTLSGPFFSEASIRSLIIYNLPVKGEYAFRKVGAIEDVTFAFHGNSRREIENQCLEYYHSIPFSWASTLTVNGKRYSVDGSFYNAQSACLAITSAP